METSVDDTVTTDSAPPLDTSTDPTMTTTLAATTTSDSDQPALPSVPSSLSTSAKFLFSDAQRDRDETTDDGISPYLLQRRKFYQPQQWTTLLQQLSLTTTLYVGNLAFYTTEEQLYSFFSLAGRVRLVRMGLNERTMTPCGFCFVEYEKHEEALECQRQLSGLMCDERVIRADLDPVRRSTNRQDSVGRITRVLTFLRVLRCAPLYQGFEEGRQFGRSKLTGGQVT